MSEGGGGGGGGGAEDKFVTLFVKKGYGVCEKAAISHEAGGLV